MTKIKFFFLIIFIFFPINILFSQEKVPLDHSVYESWNSIRNMKISDNGELIIWKVNPQKGDGVLIIYDNTNGFYDSIPRGMVADFSINSDYIAGKIKPFYLDSRKEKKEKVSDEDKVHDTLFIYSVATREVKKIPEVKSFKLAEKGSDWLVYQKEFAKPETEEKSDTLVKEEEEENKLEEKFDAIRNKTKPSDLVFYQFSTGKSFMYENVMDYAFSENGDLGLFSQLAPDSVKNTVLYAFNTSDQMISIIFEGKGSASSLCIDRKGEKASFLFSDDSCLVTGYQLYSFYPGNDRAECLIDSADSKLPQGFGVSKNGKLWYSKSGDRLFFGINLLQTEEEEDSLLPEEKYNLDIWNWNDNYLQPQQKKQLTKEKNFAYAAMYDQKNDQVIVLLKDEIKRLITQPEGEGESMLGISNDKYGKFLSWEGVQYQDVYLIDPNTGDSSLILNRIPGRVRLSPNGKYVLYFSATDADWYVYDIQEKALRNLTMNIPVSFADERNDVPRDAPAYGIAGFTSNDKYLLIYDRYDIWKFDPKMKQKPVMMTRGKGRADKNRFRYLKLDREAHEIKLDEKIYLRCFNEETMKAGYAMINEGSDNDPDILFQTKNQYYSIIKAKDVEAFVYRKADYREYPDIYYSGSDLKDAVKISDANPQAKNYLWGDAQLVNWKSFEGKDLKGILLTPENLDKNKKYPVIVYFYEQNSEGLYRYYPPSPSRSVINFPMYNSNGYVIFIPDITYKTGYPGQSAYDAIVSGTEYIIDKYKFVDKDRIGLQGQSWGGYQVAWLITRTDRFRAAMAGAPVSNMTSAYGGIRWGSGLSRMFQYEKTQSRIGGTLWDDLDLYIENSPVFKAPDVHTPLLMMHNDNDGAVPWYQGIEYFVALRRLGKPVWMLTYNNEEHNLTKWPNRIDLSKRMMQFFDHYLKDKPAPEWMVKGIPAIEKGKTDGYELME